MGNVMYFLVLVTVCLAPVVDRLFQQHLGRQRAILCHPVPGLDLLVAYQNNCHTNRDFKILFFITVDMAFRSVGLVSHTILIYLYHSCVVLHFTFRPTHHFLFFSVMKTPSSHITVVMKKEEKKSVCACGHFYIHVE